MTYMPNTLGWADDIPKWREFVYRGVYAFQTVKVFEGVGWASQDDYFRDVAEHPLAAYVDCEFRFAEPQIQPGCVAMIGCRLYEPPHLLPAIPPVETFIDGCYYGRDIVRAIKYGRKPPEQADRDTA